MLVCETEVSVRLPVAARKVTAGVIDAVPMAPEKVSVAPLAISKVPAVPDRIDRARDRQNAAYRLDDAGARNAPTCGNRPGAGDVRETLLKEIAPTVVSEAVPTRVSVV